MDKVLMKKLFNEAGLPITRYLAFSREEINRDYSDVVKKIEKSFSYPIFTKPANLGSSVGVAKAQNKKELVAGLNLACEYDRKILVEQGVASAREIEVSVLGNDTPKVSVCGEVIPSKEFYDYEDKYILGKEELIIPAKISRKLSDKIREMAVSAFKAIDCAGMARCDFLIDSKNGKIFLSEINTIPGFTKISMYPKLWRATGVSYKKLIDELIDLAIERYNDKSKNKTSYPSKLLEI
jgi:D-alanine-D-alanine ligase